MNVNLLIPGHGHEHRVSNVRLIVDRVEPTRCTIFMFNKTSLREPRCDLVYTTKKALWTTFMKQFKVVQQNLDILLIIDDVVVSEKIKRLYRSPGQDVVSASILNWHYRVMRPMNRFKHTLRKTLYVDMLAVRFSPSIWNCWVKQIDLSINPFGWGYDVSFHKSCKPNMYIQDNCTVIHPSHQNGATYSHRLAHKGQTMWLSLCNISTAEKRRIIQLG